MSQLRPQESRTDVRAPRPPIGRRLRSVRLAQRKTVTEVAHASGLTKGFLSKLESDRANASVASLMRVCEALGISVASLFESSVAGNVVRGDDYPAINFGGEELAEFLLTPPGEQRLQAILSEIGPGGGSGDELYALPDEVEVEFAFVLEGRLAVRLENEELLLEQGDALTFPGYTRHSFHNPDSIATARVLWVLAPALSRATAAARQSSSITNRPAPTRSVT